MVTRYLGDGYQVTRDQAERLVTAQERIAEQLKRIADSFQELPAQELGEPTREDSTQEFINTPEGRIQVPKASFS